jgi:hypothetical protein
MYIPFPVRWKSNIKSELNKKDALHMYGTGHKTSKSVILLRDFDMENGCNF